MTENTLPMDDGVAMFFHAAVPEPCSAVVLFVHGLNEHSGRYEGLADAFVRRGIGVYAPDYRGHGNTGRVPGFIPSLDRVSADLAALGQTIRSEHPSAPLCIYGHSLGGLIVLRHLLDYQDRYSAAVVQGAALALPPNISPAIVAISSVLSAIVPKLPVQEFDRSQLSRDPAVQSEAENDPLYCKGKVRARTGREVLRTIADVRPRLPEVRLPLLVLHGGADAVVDPSASLTVYEHASSADKTVKIFPGLYHELHNEPEREAVLRFVLDWLEPRVAANG